jgi:hypothetical protein
LLSLLVLQLRLAWRLVPRLVLQLALPLVLQWQSLPVSLLVRSLVLVFQCHKTEPQSATMVCQRPYLGLAARSESTIALYIDCLCKLLFGRQSKPSLPTKYRLGS